MTLPPLALYIHIPWCVRKCPYCDFNSHAVRDEAPPEQAYVQALLADLEQEWAHTDESRSIGSIFIGGGTPSLFSAASIDKLLSGIDNIARLDTDVEITMEANPGTFERDKFAGYKSAGVNRLSIGVQSFSAPALQALGRIHNPEEARNAAKAARRLFPHLNLDLMHGLPGQTPELAMQDLQSAIELEPDHLSWYQLTIEPNTEFHARPPQLPVDEALWSIQEQGQQHLADAGFAQYEISAYAKAPEYQARHNRNYWRFGDYLAIGAGAHGKLSRSVEGGLEISRYSKPRQPKAYLDQGWLNVERNIIEPDDLPFEFMLNALRLTEGVPASLFKARTGLDLAVITPILQRARQRGLLEADETMLQPTHQGRLFLNDLIEMFM